MYESMEQTITIIQFRCNEGMDNALSLSDSDSDSANRMKRTRKSATYVVDMWNKGEVWIKSDFKVFDNTSRLSVMTLIETVGSAGEKSEEK